MAKYRAKEQQVAAQQQVVVPPRVLNDPVRKQKIRERLIDIGTTVQTLTVDKAANDAGL